jgi:hypothetical protein
MPHQSAFPFVCAVIAISFQTTGPKSHLVGAGSSIAKRALVIGPLFPYFPGSKSNWPPAVYEGFEYGSSESPASLYHLIFHSAVELAAV